MEIWIFNQYVKPPSFSTGTRHYDMARALIKKGHSVTIFTSSYSIKNQEDLFEYKKRDYFKLEKIDEIIFVWIKTRPYRNGFGRVANMIDYYRNTRKILKEKKYGNKPDLIIGSSVHLLAPLLASEFSKKFNCEFYFEIRDFWPQTFIDFGKMSKHNPIAIILYKLEKYLFQKADKIVVLFDRAINYVEERGADPKKVIYLPNGISGVEVKENEEINKILEPYQKKKKIIYIGSHGEANDLSRILRLAERLKENKEIVFLLFGSGPYKKKLITEADKLELINIQFHDPVEKNSIPYLLTECDIGIISIKDSPLYKYGFSMNKIYDYMYAGLPTVMIVEKSLAPNFIKEGFFVSNNLETQANNILNLIENKDFFNYHSEKVKELSYNYLWDIQIQQLEKQFNT